MNAADETSMTTETPTDSESLSSDLVSPSEAPLLSLLTMQGLKPMHEMSIEETQDFIRRLRENRTAHVQMRAEMEREADEKPKAKAKSAPKKPTANLDEYA